MRSAAILAVAFGALAGCADSETLTAPDQELSVSEARGNPALASGGSYDITDAVFLPQVMPEKRYDQGWPWCDEG